MDGIRIAVREYRSDDRDTVLAILHLLHGHYKDTIVPPELLPFSEDRNLSRAYSEYLNEVEHGHGTQYMTLVAEETSGDIVGLIIGSIEHDRWDVLTPLGIIEDWYVFTERRGTGIGGVLYRQMEEWFRKNGCRQVKSDTWSTNNLGREAHAALGFVEYGVDFRKRL